MSVRRCSLIATIVELVREVIEPAIQEPYELVDIEYGKMGGDYVLSVFVDKLEGITVNDTADLTDIISPLLDSIKPDPFPDQYFLEVTSPGLERPLKTKEAVAAAVGSYIHVSLYKALDYPIFFIILHHWIKTRFSKELCLDLKMMSCSWNMWIKHAKKKLKFHII